MSSNFGNYLERFFQRVVKNVETGCWEWKGAHFRTGYTRFWDGEQRNSAHRWICEIINGEITPGYVVDHICRNKGCVNPSHMEIVDFTTNLMRGEHYNASKTHCIHGHEFNLVNTLLVVRQNGRLERCCRACARESQRKRKLK